MKLNEKECRVFLFIYMELEFWSLVEIRRTGYSLTKKNRTDFEERKTNEVMILLQAGVVLMFEDLDV